MLPKAKPLEPRRLTELELRRLREQEEATLRELRLFLRDVINKLSRDRKFSVFSRPVDTEEVSPPSTAAAGRGGRGEGG